MVPAPRSTVRMKRRRYGRGSTRTATFPGDAIEPLTLPLRVQKPLPMPVFPKLVQVPAKVNIFPGSHACQLVRDSTLAGR
ncbi:hypothetical protein Ssi03_18940 [Sphaerisporangium siamense]|nr:hypothetical protein Ssi03_18940 [Sphaerisporangium siamense]